MSSEESGGLGPLDWETLIGRIQDGKCTPFLGAGANYGLLPLGAEIADAWAHELKFPGGKTPGLEEISQFLAVQAADAVAPKDKISRLLRERLARHSDAELEQILSAPDNPLSLVADLPLPVYITTNYDDLIERALRTRGKDARQEVCRWNSKIRELPSAFDAPGGYRPTPDKPIVFHLHGSFDVADSLVLTEDDYLDFLVSTSRHRILPPRIEEAMTGASLLFLGYRLADINFRMIFRGLVGALEGSLRRMNVSVQLPPPSQDKDSAAWQEYMKKYFEANHVRIFWGSAQMFSTELRERLERGRGGA
jgi:hypothetical protein